MMIKDDWSKLTDKQQQTISLYMKTGNKLGSYTQVYDCTNMTQKTTLRNCYAFYKKPKIKSMIEHIQSKAVKRASVTLDEIMNDTADELVKQQRALEQIAIDAGWVLKRAALLADFNIRTFIRTDENGNAVYDFSDATDDDWYCIQEYTVEEIARGQGDDKYFVDKLKLKTYDKLRALELVGKHIDVQAFKDQSDVNVTGEVVHRTLNDFYADTNSETES